MVRAPSYDKYGMKKGAWSPDEDYKLRSYIQRHGHWNWRELPRFAGLKRCGKSCRLRWMNYLRPELKHGSFTEEEDVLIMKLHEQFGNRWSKIAASLPGRTDNEIKNHWHTHLKKRAMGNLTSSEVTDTHNSDGQPESIVIDTPPITILESSSLSPTSSSSATDQLPSYSSSDSTSGSTSMLNNVNVIDHIYLPSSEMYVAQSSGDFLSEPIVANNIYPSSSERLYIYKAQSSGDFWSEPFVADNIIYNQDERLGFGLPYDMYYEYGDSADMLYHQYLCKGWA